MNPERVRAIAETLDALTDDEDVSQDAWVFMLETGTDPVTAFHHAAQQAAFVDLLARRVASLARDCDHIPLTISIFHESEQSVLILLMIGFSVQQILQYKGMCTVRLAQMLVSISRHPCWGECDGPKEETLG